MTTQILDLQKLRLQNLEMPTESMQAGTHITGAMHLYVRASSQEAAKPEETERHVEPIQDWYTNAVYVSPLIMVASLLILALCRHQTAETTTTKGKEKEKEKERVNVNISEVPRRQNLLKSTQILLEKVL